MSQSTQQERFAFKSAEQHHGLRNETGQNNCFLNVTIQALWHLGPFREHLLQWMAAMETNTKLSKELSNNSSLLYALCHLFTQYHFTDQMVLPPDELREVLSKLDAKYGFGKIADASETLDTILHQIHAECSDFCPSSLKCLSDATFGGTVLEQSICHVCGASSEPSIRSTYLLYFQVAELISEFQKATPSIPLLNLSKSKATDTATTSMTHHHTGTSLLHWSRHSTPTLTSNTSTATDYQNEHENMLKAHQFGKMLHTCLLATGEKSCPSLDETVPTRMQINSYLPCRGKARDHMFSLEPPLILALSLSWPSSNESKENLLRLYSMLPDSIYIKDVFSSYDHPEQVIMPRDHLPPVLQNTSHMYMHPPTHTSHASASYTLGAEEKADFKPDAKPSYEITGNSVPVVDSDWRCMKATSPTFHHLPDRSTGSIPTSTSAHAASTGPSYLFRGMVCYYGLHYVSIFQIPQHNSTNPTASTSSKHSDDSVMYFLFDDQTVRPIGNWIQVVELCLLSMYQPVLILYELANTSNNASIAQVPDYSKVTAMVQVHAHTQSNNTQQHDHAHAHTAPTTAEEKVFTPTIAPETKTIQSGYVRLDHNLAQEQISSTMEPEKVLSNTAADTMMRQSGQSVSSSGNKSISDDYDMVSDAKITSQTNAMTMKEYEEDGKAAEKRNTTIATNDDWEAYKYRTSVPGLYKFPFDVTKESKPSFTSAITRAAISNNNTASTMIQPSTTVIPVSALSNADREVNEIRQRMNLPTQYLVDSNNFTASPKEIARTSSIPKVNTSNPVTDYSSNNVFGSAHTSSGYQFPTGFSSYTTVPTNPTRYTPSPVTSTASAAFQSKHMSSEQMTNILKPPTGYQTIITRWGRKLKEYFCTLPVTYVKNCPVLGFYVQADEEGHIVICGFYRHPVTHAMLPPERDQQIQLLDRIRTINGVALRKHITPTEVDREYISRIDGRYVSLSLQSAHESQISYYCPHCRAVNQLTAEIENTLRDMVRQDYENKGVPIQCFKCKQNAVATREYLK